MVRGRLSQILLGLELRWFCFKKVKVPFRRKNIFQTGGYNVKMKEIS